MAADLDVDFVISSSVSQGSKHQYHSKIADFAFFVYNAPDVRVDSEFHVDFVIHIGNTLADVPR